MRVALNNPPSSFVAIYGGSFDPLHKAHSEIIRLLCEDSLFWHIILLPNYANPLKPPPLFSALERLKMCQIMANAYNARYSSLTSLPKVAVSDYEVGQNKPVFSMQSIGVIEAQMRQTYPHAQFAFVLGSDSFASLAQWNQPQKLCKMVQFVLIHRKLLHNPQYPQSLKNPLPQSHTESIDECKMPLKAKILKHFSLGAFDAFSSSKVRYLLENARTQAALEMIPTNIHSIIKTHFQL
ncbi:nicotinate-nicotinamide nucleotide adenylyltransferase [uncultured Helicobacter sp.]|uniref:nicotinate-nicotinamide nucleotide adenylyltransferase n=1 Tax=uncultured Helicobacter sp. TaxID=175537 RepID=UPI00261FA2D4|nr:nicotinate-nicotinamide nucleotide adenylyltransferase [uncultured Helicobacter sp.]